MACEAGWGPVGRTLQEPGPACPGRGLQKPPRQCWDGRGRGRTPGCSEGSGVHPAHSPSPSSWSAGPTPHHGLSQCALSAGPTEGPPHLGAAGGTRRPLGPTRQLRAWGPWSPSSRGGGGAGLGADGGPTPPPQSSRSCPLLGCPCPTAGAERTCSPALLPPPPPPPQLCIHPGGIRTQPQTQPPTARTHPSRPPGPPLPTPSTWSRARGTPLGPHQERRTPICPRDTGRGGSRQALHSVLRGAGQRGRGL